jgi:hypothetical protein
MAAVIGIGAVIFGVLIIIGAALRGPKTPDDHQRSS